VKIPTLDSPQVSPSGRGAPNLRVEGEGGREAVARGLGEIAQATNTAGIAIGRDMEIQRQKGIAADTTDGETELTRYATEEFYGRRGSGNAVRDGIEQAFTGEPTSTKGYLNMQGRSAFDESPAVSERLEKKRREIADNMGSQEARDLFLHRTAGQLEGYRTTIQRHAGHQAQVADLATLEARKNVALEAVRLNPNNLTEVDTHANALNGPLQALSLSDDDSIAKVREWHGEVAIAQASAQLERGDWQSAEATLANKGGLLPDKARKTLGAAIEKQRHIGEADALAGQMVSAATNEVGEVNQAVVLRRLNALPAEQQARVRPVVYQRMAEQEQAFAADTKRISTAAHSVYNRVGWTEFAKQPIADELNERNPELYNRLQDDGQAEADRLARKKRDTKEDRRAQQNIDTIALNQFLSLPPEERSETDVDEWARGRGMSPVARSSLGKLKESARQVTERGQAATESEFVKRAIADAEGSLEQGTTPQAKGRRRAQEIALEAEARRWFSEWVTEHEGKAPTDADIAAKSGQMAVGRVPIGDAGAAQQADIIIRRGNSRDRVLPEMDFTGGQKPSKAARAKALKAEGLGNADIAKRMTEEGY
jgi:hypothetical protein